MRFAPRDGLILWRDRQGFIWDKEQIYRQDHQKRLRMHRGYCAID